MISKSLNINLEKRLSNDNPKISLIPENTERIDRRDD